MIARQLATGLTIRALFEADVAVRLLAFLFLGEARDEVSRAALALGLLAWSLHEPTVSHERILSSEHRLKDACWDSFTRLLESTKCTSEELICERVGGLRCSLTTRRSWNACTHAVARDLRFTVTSSHRDGHRSCPSSLNWQLNVLDWLRNFCCLDRLSDRIHLLKELAGTGRALDAREVAGVDKLAPFVLASIAVVGVLDSTVGVAVVVHHWVILFFLIGSFCFVIIS